MRLSFILHFFIIFVVVVPLSVMVERLFLTGLLRDPVHRPVVAIISTCFFAVCVVGFGMPWIGDLPAAIGLSGLAFALWRVRQGRRERTAAGYRPAAARARYGAGAGEATADRTIVEATPVEPPTFSDRV